MLACHLSSGLITFTSVCLSCFISLPCDEMICVSLQPPGNNRADNLNAVIQPLKRTDAMQTILNGNAKLMEDIIILKIILYNDSLAAFIKLQ